jgi:Short C-terminal domain
MFMRPMVVRRRPLLRAAAIGGTFAAGRAMGRRAEDQQYAEADQNQRISDPEAAQGGQDSQGGQGGRAAGQNPPPGQAQAGETSVMEQLSRLAAMHDQGALTDDEFAAAKARVLGG